jgi:hypothetical protein
MTAEGHAIPSPDPNAEDYHRDHNDFIIVSPMGTTLNNGLFGYLDEDNIADFLKRLYDKNDIRAPSPGQP